jgi:acetoin utilization protein AcuB
MKVKDCMQRKPITVTPEDTVSTAYQRMWGSRIRHLPVVTAEGKLVGIVTDRDLRQAGASDEPHMAVYELGYLLDKMTVADVMTKKVVTVQGETPIAEAGELFVKKKFGCLPVVADDNILEGIITVTDMLQLYVTQHEGA